MAFLCAWVGLLPLSLVPFWCLVVGLSFGLLLAGEAASWAPLIYFFQALGPRCPTQEPHTAVRVVGHFQSQ